MGRKRLSACAREIDAEILWTVDDPALPQRLDGLCFEDFVSALPPSLDRARISPILATPA
jgi:hypothetical protein